MAWTDARVDTLKSLWKKGLSASQIAEELGEVTRNAVIGKAHRLGLSSRPSPVKKPAKAKRKEPAKKSVVIEPEAPGPAGKRDRITILDLTDRICKWPIGHPGEPEFHFCGRRSAPVQPYCAFHAAMAYQAPQPRKDRRRNR